MIPELMKNDSVFIYGKHVLEEALASRPETIEKVFLTNKNDQRLIDQIRKAKVTLAIIDERTLPKDIDQTAHHQGVIAIVRADKLVRDFGDFLKKLPVNPNTALVLLNEIQDPQNVGAIIRSAAAFGMAGILIPEHHQSPITGSVIKVSAGMAFRVPLISIGNTNHTIEELKKAGFWIYGLDEDATMPIAMEKFDAPAVFVLGNENRGIREKTREHCDILLSVPMAPNCESLNVASSATVAFYAWSVKHQQALK